MVVRILHGTDREIAEMLERWVKLHESTLESEVFSDPWLLKLFIWCLIRASFKDQKIAGTVVKRGSFLTGRNVAAAELNCHPSRWYRGIQRLVEMGCITATPNRDRTTITVCNYSHYQDVKTKGEQQSNSARTSIEHQSNINRTAIEQQSNTEEERKKAIREEGKKGRKEEGAAPLAFDSDSFSSAWTMFTAHRTAIKKPLTTEAVRLAQKKLAGMGEVNAILALENSVANGWQGIFEPKESRAGPASKFPSRTEQTLNAAQEYLRRKREQETDDGQRAADGVLDGSSGCVQS